MVRIHPGLPDPTNDPPQGGFFVACVLAGVGPRVTCRILQVPRKAAYRYLGRRLQPGPVGRGIRGLCVRSDQEGAGLMTDDMAAIFREELRDLLESLERGLLDLKARPEDVGLINQVFREHLF